MKQRITAFLVALFCCAIGFAGNIQADDVSLNIGCERNGGSTV